MLTRPDKIEQGASITASHADCAGACCTCRLTLRKKTPACELLLKAANSRTTASHVSRSTKRAALVRLYHQSFKPDCLPGLSLRACTCACRSLQRKVSKRRAFITVTSSRTEDPNYLPSLSVRLSACLSANLLRLLPTASICPLVASTDALCQRHLAAEAEDEVRGRCETRSAPWFWWRRVCRRGLSPEHQVPIRTSQRLGGVGQGAGCQGGVWPCSQLPGQSQVDLWLLC